MKFKQLFESARSYKKELTKKELALKVSEESGEVAKAVATESPDRIKSEIGDLLACAIALYLRYEDDVETLKPIIGKKLL